MPLSEQVTIPCDFHTPISQARSHVHVHIAKTDWDIGARVISNFSKSAKLDLQLTQILLLDSNVFCMYTQHRRSHHNFETSLDTSKYRTDIHGTQMRITTCKIKLNKIKIYLSYTSLHYYEHYILKKTWHFKLCSLELGCEPECL